MLELMKQWQDNDLKTFIVSTGGLEFMTPRVEDVYHIPRKQVV